MDMSFDDSTLRVCFVSPYSFSCLRFQAKVE